MSTYTENYRLTMPEENDYYDVEVYNDNLNTLDNELASTATEVETINDKIGSPDDMGTDTVFGKLNNNNFFIKSMQNIDFAVTTNGNSITKSISPVNPDRCIIQMLLMTVQSGTDINYVLNEDNLCVTAIHGNTSLIQNLRFQIIEFY